LVETLVALILSKFVIVATLSLAAGAVASGASGAPNSGGFSAVLGGGALLVMATFVPFAILRLIPAIEAGAVGHLDGLRQRATSTVSTPLRTAANHALHAGLTSAGDAGHMAQAAAGKLGGVTSGTAPESPEELVKKVDSNNGGQVPDAEGRGIGDPNSPRILEEATARGVQSPPKGPKPLVGLTAGSGDEGGAAGAGAAGGGAAGVGLGAGLGAGADTVGPPSAHPSAAAIAPPRPPGRPGTGPANPADAWKWKDVPPDRGFMHPVEPGKDRFYIDYDEHGPKMVGLDPVWPPDGQEGGA
jgi:hypothetical protein